MSSPEYDNKGATIDASASEMKDSASTNGSEGIPQSEAREDVTFHQDTSEERDEPTSNDSSTPRKKPIPVQANAAGPAHRKPKKPQDSQQQPQQLQSQQPPNNGRFYGGGMQHPQTGAHFGAGMPRGPYHHGGPYPYAAAPGNSGPPFHGYHHAHAHQMPPMPPHFNGGAGGPYAAAMNARGSANNGGAGGSGGPYSHYGNHPYPGAAASNMPPTAAYSSHGMPPSYPTNSSSNMSDSASIGSKGSKSSKKRTIDGVHESSSSMGPSASAYAFRRSDSNTSTTSTVTAGNNTSIETYATEDTSTNNNKAESSHRASEMLVPSSNFDDYDHQYNNNNNEGRPMRTRYHRRDCSADGSTTSSLSAGFSLASYEGRRDPSDNPICKSSPKRMKGGDGEPLSVDTHMRPPSAASHEADQSTRFEQLSIGVKEEPETTKSDSSNESGNQKLFLSLSTSPINADVDATPISKNTTKPAEGNKKHTEIFKKKNAAAATLNLEVSTSASSSGSTPPPPPQSDHGDLGEVDMMGDDHSTLNRHLRGQTFTPVNHLSSNATDQASSHADGQFSIAPQLSWNSITGDTPSLGDLAEWEEESKSKHSAAADQKIKPSSTVDSHESRGMSISPHDFHLWKEDHELVDQAIGGATTPLPAFFDSGREGNDRSENQMTNYDTRAKKHSNDEARPTFVTSSNRNHGHGNHSARPMPHHWNKHDHPMNHNMPPTPQMYTSGAEYRDDAYPMVRSPYGGDRRDQIDGAGAFPFFPHPGMHNNERVRNLRGRMPPGHFPPMLHIPPPMQAQLPMTSPMAMPNKAGLWSPHGGLPPLNSPHHLTSPMNSMHGQTKRKCVPLKPPIPSKFQGDPEKVKNVPVPEFTSLVNFPSHMSQKQAVNLPEGMRCCVMCGNACPSSNGGKNKNKKKAGDGGLAQRSSNSQDMIGDKSSGYAQIPTQNKGLCTLCDVNVWVVVANGLEIKWCKGCKNFRPWAAFGDKGLATKCLRCRERQREKYALQKEEKEKARNAAAIKNKS